MTSNIFFLFFLLFFHFFIFFLHFFHFFSSFFSFFHGRLNLDRSVTMVWSQLAMKWSLARSTGGLQQPQVGCAFRIITFGWLRFGWLRSHFFRYPAWNKSFRLWTKSYKRKKVIIQKHTLQVVWNSKSKCFASWALCIQ